MHECVVRTAAMRTNMTHTHNHTYISVHITYYVIIHVIYICVCAWFVRASGSKHTHQSV